MIRVLELNLGEHVVDGAFFRPAFVFFKVGLKLLFGPIGIEQKFLAGTERQPADVAIRRTWRGADKPHDDELSVRHSSIMASRATSSQINAVLCGSKIGLAGQLQLLRSDEGEDSSTNS